MTILAKLSFMLDNYWTNKQIYGIFLMTKAITMLLTCNFTNTVKKPELCSGQQVKIALLSTVKVFKKKKKNIVIKKFLYFNKVIF